MTTLIEQNHPSELEISEMTPDEANECASNIRMHRDKLRSLLFEFHQRKGWKALGYTGWLDCIQNEFGIRKSTAYRHIDSRRIELELGVEGIADAHIRELKALATPEDRKAAWRRISEGNLTVRRSAAREIIRQADSLLHGSVREVKKGKEKDIQFIVNVDGTEALVTISIHRLITVLSE